MAGSDSIDASTTGLGLGLGEGHNTGTGTGTGTSRTQQGDLVTTSLSFLLVHLKIDGTAWAPLLSTIFVGMMTMMTFS